MFPKIQAYEIGLFTDQMCEVRAHLGASGMHVEVDVRVHRCMRDFSLTEQLEPICVLTRILFYSMVIEPIAFVTLFKISAEFWKHIV